jgi:hypothetical protein
MNDAKKYFGMTRTQVGILGGLAATALLLFCVTGWLMFGGRLGLSLSRPPIETPIPQSTPTLILSPTPTSTEASTPIPYEQLIPSGWVQYRTDLYEIWMSPGYASASADVLITGLGNASIVDLSLRGSYSTKSPHKIYVTVSYEPLTADGLDAFIAQRLSELGPYLSLGERTKTDINAVPAVRLMFSGRKGNNIDINELTYVIQDGTTVWYVQYTAEITEFYAMLPTFEESAKTFRVVR